MEDASKKWLKCGDYEVFVWSIAGLETSVVVRSNNLNVAFDMGYSSRESIGCKDVFISHGHMDHIAAIPQHVSKRNLLGMLKATYYVPTHLPELVKSVGQQYRSIDETTEALVDINVVPFGGDDKAQLTGGFFVKSFPTFHRVRSQGYILYKTSRTLKSEYRGRSGMEVSALHREGVEIHDVTITPEVAYLGDTTFEAFESSLSLTPDLLKAKVIITEATYIEEESGKDRVVQARERGHTHLSEILHNADMFTDVEHIILMHMSDKYPVSFLKHHIPPQIPPSLQGKIQIATLAKERTS